MSYLLDALGFVGDTVGRPGAAVRGLLAGRPDQLYNLLPGSESMGLLDPERKVSGRDLNRMYGLAGDEDTWSNWLGGLATETLADPLSIYGVVKGAGRLLGAGAGASPGRAARLMDKRRGFGFVEVEPSGVPGRGTLRAPEFTPVGRSEQKQLAVLSTLPELAGAAGGYLPGLNAGWLRRGASATTRRHENVHGLIDQAAKTGDMAGLPAVARPAAWLKQGTAPGEISFRSGLGAVAEELAAQTLEKKGLLEQLRGAARFLFDNPFDPAQQRVRRVYADAFRELSPGAARLYQAAGYAPHALGGLAAGGLGLGVAGRLNQGVEEG
jgi:hypothetical protein